MMRIHHGLFLSIAVLSWSCGEHEADSTKEITGPSTPEKLFHAVPSSNSGVDFANHITEDAERNYFNYQYMYNGGGVAIGDINNDGLPDIYFTGNEVSDKLYLNKGGLAFEDITQTAVPGSGDGWHNGVTMADVNADGYLDIYVCRSGYAQGAELTSNLLYINNGDLTFSERAKEFGVADTSHSTQAAFFDMDLDGDLDLYVMNVPFEQQANYSNVETLRRIKERLAPTDRLYLNEGGHFKDVTYELGVPNYAYGLGLGIADIDQDGWPDVYESNDYDRPDHLFMNQQGKALRDEIQQRLRHISNFGMGCDIADMNNDALPDIIVLDMVSEDHVRSKENMPSMRPERYWQLVRAGYHFQHMVNTLQLNNGNGTFSEIAQLAGVARTDWSWSPLFADLDNDGWKDLIVTNGFKRDMRNNDFVGKYEAYAKKNTTQKFDDIISLVPSTRIKNYLFRNKRDLTFDNVTEEWGFDVPLNSNGAAYADLDNDGDLDVVINNIDALASLFENTTSEKGNKHYLRLAFKHSATAKTLGAKAYVFTKHGTQYQELYPTRGYQSSVEPILHFGLGDATQVDSLIVQFPGGNIIRQLKLGVDQVLTLDHHSAISVNWSPRKAVATLMQATEGVKMVHQEMSYDDFKIEVLLPHKLSELGPGMATGDANGDGLMDLFITGSHGVASALYLQNGQGGFSPSTSAPWNSHAEQEHLDALFFDADGDGDQDLVVTTGSNEHDVRELIMTQRFYRNEGGGKFVIDDAALPPMQTSAQRIASVDFDRDGDMDLFIAGRSTPGHYPFVPRSFLLQNDGTGHFTDVSGSLGGRELMGPGMITGCAFADMDGDGTQDLVTLGEWMAVTVFAYRNGKFTRIDSNGLDSTHGWWSSLAIADVDADGDMDIIGGNLGWNSKYHATATKPLHVYRADFDEDGRSDMILAKGDQGHLLPVRGRECSSEQNPVILEKFPTYEKFAHASLNEIYGKEKLDKAIHYQATLMRSTVFLNDGKGNFAPQALPNLAQTSPINAIIPIDVNNDGKLDLVCTGNNWSAEVETVRYDAGNGLVLLGDGKGNFQPLSIAASGFFTPGNSRDMVVMDGTTGRRIVVSNNQGPLQTFVLINGATSPSAK